MEAVRTSETSVDNHFTRQYNPEDNFENDNALETSHRVVQSLFGENIADVVVMEPLSSNTASRRNNNSHKTEKIV
jgi:hypothetical protein